MLRKQSGNMYPFVTHTWNPIKGMCSHDCTYCYMKRFELKPIRLDEKELETDLGEGNFIFVGSGTDMWARNVPARWISLVLERTKEFPKNTYLFQSKSPVRFMNFSNEGNRIYGTTIETNRQAELSQAPGVAIRANSMSVLSDAGCRTMITIEPIVDFDPDIMVHIVSIASPEWVNIGADSKGHNLPEPSSEKALELINTLKQFTEVKLKKNLSRILGYPVEEV